MCKTHLQKKLFFVLFLIFLFSPLIAQDWDDDYEDEEDRDVYISSNWTPYLYARGDQLLNISLGITVPLIFIGDKGIINHNLSGVGIVFSLAYDHFLNPEFSIGGEVNAMGSLTKGRNFFYIIPFGIRAGYQLSLYRFNNLPSVWRRLEIPFSLTVGGVAYSYLDNEQNYFGLFVKPRAGVFFRFNQDWSFGVNTAWWWLPQWTRDSSKNVYGNFMEITLSARYHF